MSKILRVSGTERGEYAIVAQFKKFAGVVPSFKDVLLSPHRTTETKIIELDDQAATNLLKEIENA